MQIWKTGHNALMNEVAGDGGEGGGGAAPAATAGTGDVSTSEGTGGGESGDGDFDFSALMGEMGGGDSGTTDGTSTVQPPATTAPAPAAPAAGTAPAQPTPAAVAPAAPAATAPTSPAPAAEPTQSETPEQQREQSRLTAYNGLVQSWSQQLSPEIMEQLMTDPQVALPQLFAQVELRALETAMRHTISQVSAALPRMIEGFVQTQQTAASLEQTFFSEFPYLKEHEGDVAAAVQAMRAQPGYDFSKPETRRQIAGLVVAQKNLWAQAAGQVAPAPAAFQGGPSPAPMGSSMSPAPTPVPKTSEDDVWTSLLDES